MKITNVYLSGLGVFQPPVTDAGEAARRGHYDRASYLENRLTGAGVAGDVSPPEMAVHAARQALPRAAVDPAGIGLVLHASILLQGPEMWLPGLYVQREIVGTRSPRSRSGWAATACSAALEIAAGHLAGAAARARRCW